MKHNYLDRTLLCQDCGKEILWSATDQEYYAVQGFDHPPKRCPECRRVQRRRKRSPLKQHKVICAGCGRETSVPFLPRRGRPVYCLDCYEEISKTVDVA